MKKIKLLLLGMTAFALVIGTNANVCYAATNEIVCNVIASKISASYQYGTGGHQVKVIVHYKEQDLADGSVIKRTAYDIQNGINTKATVVKKNTSGYKIIEGKAFGAVDGKVVAGTGVIEVK